MAKKLGISLCGAAKWQIVEGKIACLQCWCDKCSQGPCYDCSGECPVEVIRACFPPWKGEH